MMTEQENDDVNLSGELDHSSDELAGLISKARELGGKPARQTAAAQRSRGEAAQRALLERQRDALRLENRTLTEQLEELRAHRCPPPPPPPGGRLVALLLGLVAGAGLAWLAARHLSTQSSE